MSTIQLRKYLWSVHILDVKVVVLNLDFVLDQILVHLVIQIEVDLEDIATYFNYRREYGAEKYYIVKKDSEYLVIDDFKTGTPGFRNKEDALLVIEHFKEILDKIFNQLNEETDINIFIIIKLHEWGFLPNNYSCNSYLLSTCKESM